MKVEYCDICGSEIKGYGYDRHELGTIEGADIRLFFDCDICDTCFCYIAAGTKKAIREITSKFVEVENEI